MSEKAKQALDASENEMSKRHEQTNTSMEARQSQELNEARKHGPEQEQATQEKHKNEKSELQEQQQNEIREIAEKRDALEQQLQGARRDVVQARHEGGVSEEVAQRLSERQEALENLEKEVRNLEDTQHELKEKTIETINNKNTWEEYANFAKELNEFVENDLQILQSTDGAFERLNKQEKFNKLVGWAKELNVDLELQEHRDAKYHRGALNKKGTDLESAHLLQQFLSRLNSSLASAREALTVLLEPGIHDIVDRFWKDELVRIRDDKNLMSNTTVGDWIRINDKFWSEDFNPTLKAQGLPTFTHKQIGVMVFILFHEMVVRSGRELSDPLIFQ